MTSLEFTRGFRRDEFEQLLDAGSLATVSAGRLPAHSLEGSWHLVLRGALSMCEDHDGARRLAVVGPGRIAASEAFVESGLLVSREGATLLSLPEARVQKWQHGGERWTHRALEALVRGLMDRLAEDTRSLARERRQSIAGLTRTQGTNRG